MVFYVLLSMWYVCIIVSGMSSAGMGMHMYMYVHVHVEASVGCVGFQLRRLDRPQTITVYKWEFIEVHCTSWWLPRKILLAHQLSCTCIQGRYHVHVYCGSMSMISLSLSLSLSHTHTFLSLISPSSTEILDLVHLVMV